MRKLTQWTIAAQIERTISMLGFFVVWGHIDTSFTLIQVVVTTWNYNLWHLRRIFPHNKGQSLMSHSFSWKMDVRPNTLSICYIFSLNFSFVSNKKYNYFSSFLDNYNLKIIIGFGNVSCWKSWNQVSRQRLLSKGEPKEKCLFLKIELKIFTH